MDRRGEAWQMNKMEGAWQMGQRDGAWQMDRRGEAWQMNKMEDAWQMDQWDGAWQMGRREGAWHNRQKAKPRMRFPAKGMLFVALAIGIYTFWTNAQWSGSPGTHGANGAHGAQSATGPANPAHPPAAGTQGASAERGDIILSSDNPGFTVPVHIDEITDSHYLELVNLEHAISGEPDGRSIVSAWPDVPVRVTGILLHETAIEAVSELFAEARASEAGTYFVSSGYRDYDAQKLVYDEMMDKSYAQPPGHSEHQTGFGVDIMAIGVSQADMGASPEARWLADNSWKHGLALRYAEGKQSITGIADEPWHFRYIGQPHAWYCWENDLCLEEYIQFLKETGSYRATLGGKYYTVYCQSPHDGIIYVPDSPDYWVSGDNAGGYVVTAWED